MYEWVPFLAGEYLTYQEYYALTYFMAFFLKFVFCFTLGNQLYNYAYYEKPVSGFIIMGTRDVVKALAFIITCYSFLILSIAITWWSAFSIVPIYVTMILNLLVVVVIYAYIQQKMNNVKNVIKQFNFQNALSKIRKQYIFWMLPFVLIALFIPIFFDRTCVCLYEDHKEYIMPYNILGYECLLNTRLYRSLTMEEQCTLEEPCHVFATLPEDTAHEVFINIQTHISIEKLQLRYISGVINSEVQRFDDLEPRGQRLQHVFHIKNLIPGTVYKFEYTLGTKIHELKYRTLRAQYTVQKPLILASGGDVGNSKAAKDIWKQLQEFDLDVILIGGDLAYDNNNVNCYWTWDLYLDELDNLQKAKNRVIPIIQAIGNHDIGLNPYPNRKIQLKSNQAYPIYFSYFPQHLHKGNIPKMELRQSFFIQKLGQYVLFTLDSAYLSSHVEQAQWMDNYLKINKNTELLAQYHHPIYSSSKIADYEGKVFQLGQLYWTSRFDKYNFTGLSMRTTSTSISVVFYCATKSAIQVEFYTQGMVVGEPTFQTTIQWTKSTWPMSKGSTQSGYLSIMEAKLLSISPQDHKARLQINLHMMYNRHYDVIKTIIINYKMFENFPLLKGLYMTYGQYYAVSFSLVFFLKFIIFWIIGTQLYEKSKITRKLKTDNLQVKVQGYRDVVRVLGFLCTTFSIFCLIATFTSLNAFRLVPLWAAIIANIFALTFLLSFTLLKMDSVSMKDVILYLYKFTMKSGYNALVDFKLSKLFKYIIGFIFLYGIMLPVFFQGTCICFFEEDRSYLLSLKALRLPGSFNTAFFRLFLIDKICADQTKPCHIYATLPEESSSQVFINVHTHKSFNKPLSMTYSDGKSGVHFNVTKSQVFQFNDLEDLGQRNLHTFYLKDLTPDTTYTLSFVLKGVKHTYSYRTLVDKYTKTRPIRIVNGGDVGNSVNANLLWEQIAKQDPDVIFIGGDLAYDNNLPDCYWTWDLYLDQFDLLSQKVGRLVPFIQAIGNHDAGLNPYSKTTIPFGDGFANPQYLSYFPHHLNSQNTIPYISQRKTYFATKLGQAVYFTLDSGYLVSYPEQAAYIDNYIAQNKPINKFAQYHHPIYSATTIIDYEGINFQEGSLYWVSRFDKYHFNTIYENHQHIHKRTKLLKGHLEHPEGTLYLGDGCWGADVTGSEINKHDYLDNAQRFNTVWISDIFEDKIHHFAITTNGDIVDDYNQSL